MSDRSKTIWNLIIGVFVLSIIATGFKIFPMNKKYNKIKERSKNSQFGTDEELENVIAFLEKRLEERNNYQFQIGKEPMVLTNVLSIDGSGRRSRRNKSAIRVALIYQRDDNFQAQVDYRGKIFSVTAGEYVENIGNIILIDKNQVLIKNESRLVSYPAPGIEGGQPKEIKNYPIQSKYITPNQIPEKKSKPISLIKKKVVKSNADLFNSKIAINSRPMVENKHKKNMKNNESSLQVVKTQISNAGKLGSEEKIRLKNSLVENMFNTAIAKKNSQSRNRANPLINSESKSDPSTTIKKIKKPAVDYGISFSPTSIYEPKKKKSEFIPVKISKQGNRFSSRDVKKNKNSTDSVLNMDRRKMAGQPKNISEEKITRMTSYPTWKHELQVLLGLPKPIVNGNPGLMSFNELKLFMKSQKDIDNSIFQQNYNDVGYENFQKYLDENETSIISMLRNRKNSSL